MSSVATLVFCHGAENKRTYGRLDEEYIADFCQVSRRNLGRLDYKIFRNFFLLGADWRLCCRQMDCDRGDFFHAVYRIQETLGRIYREMEPYSLFPLDEYFSGKVVKTNLAIMPKPIRPPAVQPPLKKSA